MNAVRLAAAAVALVAGLAVTTVAAEKPDVSKDKLVGTWEFVKGDGLPPEAKVEFTKDGKLKVSFENNKEKVVLDGTYALDGATMKVMLKTPDGKEIAHSMSIEKLTATELVTKNELSKIAEFKKVTPK